MIAMSMMFMFVKLGGDVVTDKIFLGSAEDSNQEVYGSMVLRVSLLRMYT